MELTTLLERTKLEHLADQLDGVCEQAATGDLAHKGFLARALSAQRREPLEAGPPFLGQDAGAIRL